MTIHDTNMIINDDNNGGLPNSPPNVKPLELPNVMSSESRQLLLIQEVAMLDAFGVGVVQIEAQLGLPAGKVISLRILPQYRMMLQTALRAKAQARIEAADNIDDMFNNEIAASAMTLIELRDNPCETGKTRITAAKDLLDRAPKAPKIRREVDERHTIISLPVGDLRNMQQALIEEGTQDDLEVAQLIKGQDYFEMNDSQGDENGAGEQEIEIVAVG